MSRGTSPWYLEVEFVLLSRLVSSRHVRKGAEDACNAAPGSAAVTGTRETDVENILSIARRNRG